jgi:predicted nucleic acid-binding protein
MVLPDTSVWVDFSRHGDHGRAAGMRALLDADQVATCGPIAAELLAGSEGEVAERIWQTLSSLPWAELASAAWQEVGTIAHSLRKAGERLPLTDLVIAVASVRAGFELWTFDSDFQRIRSVLRSLELYEPT